MSGPDEFDSPESVQEWIRERMRRLLEWKRRLYEATSLEELLNLLIEFGFQDEDLATVLPGTSERTVQRWRTKGVPASKVAEEWRHVDDLRAVVNYMLADGSYDEFGILAWMRSRHPDLKMNRPLEELGEGNFEEVLYAVDASLDGTTTGGSDLLRDLQLISFSDAVKKPEEGEEEGE